MDTLRWRDGWQDYELRVRRRADDALPADGHAWTEVAALDALRARALLARCASPERLRALLADDPLCAPRSMSDVQVIEHAAAMLAAGRWRLRVRVPGSATSASSSSPSSAGAGAASDQAPLPAAAPRTHAGLVAAMAARRNPAPRTPAATATAAPAPAQAPVATPAPAPGTDPSPRYWIEIELLGEDDRPIGGIDYRLELSDGSILTGRLDGAGLARHQGLTQGGDCRICFPQLDEDAWSFIRSRAA